MAAVSQVSFSVPLSAAPSLPTQSSRLAELFAETAAAPQETSAGRGAMTRMRSHSDFDEKERSSIEPRKISKVKFDKVFVGAHDVDMGHFKIVSAGKPLQTTGLATCIGAVAITYTKGKPTKVGIMHDVDITKGDRLFDFCDAMRAEGDKVEVYLTGASQRADPEYLKTANNIPCMNITQQLNPFNINIRIRNLHSPFIDKAFRFGVSLGITEDLEVLLADETRGFERSNGDFSNFAELIKDHLKSKCDCSSRFASDD